MQIRVGDRDARDQRRINLVLGDGGDKRCAKSDCVLRAERDELAGIRCLVGIGRASCRERGVDLGGRRIIKKKKKKKYKEEDRTEKKKKENKEGEEREGGI